MKRLKWLATILGTIAVSILPAVAVSAANPLTVTMVNTPQFTNGISSFTVTYVSDTEMDLNWTLDTNYPSTAQNIMIRAKYGSYPANIPNENTAPTDGYLVFYGDGTATTSAVDTSMDMNQNLGTLYYTAWAQKANGTWYVTTGTSSKESKEMIFLGLIAIAGVLSLLTVTSKNIILSIVAGAAWIGLIPYLTSNSPTGLANGSTAQQFVIIALAGASIGIVLYGIYVNYINRKERNAEVEYHVKHQESSAQPRNYRAVMEADTRRSQSNGDESLEEYKARIYRKLHPKKNPNRY